MKKKWFVSLFILLCFYTSSVFAQNNSTPIIYRLTGQLFSLPTSGEISIIDPLTQNEINQISLSRTPGEVLQISQDEKKAFVVPLFDNGLIVVDLFSGSIKTILSSLLIYGAKQSPDGTLWVLASIPDNQIILVDPKTLITLNVLTNITKPRDIVFSPDGKKAFISLENNNILIFDTKTRSLLSTISNLPLGITGFTRYMELAISSDGKMLCFGTKNNLFFIDTSSLQTVDLVTFNNKSTTSRVLVLFNNNNDAVYVCEKNGLNLYKYTLKDKTFSTIFISKRFALQDMKLSPDGRLLYISDFGGKSIIDTLTDAVIFSVTDLPQTNSKASEGLALAGDFSIGQAPSLQTTAPAASQQIAANQAFSIKWQTMVMPQSYSIASHKIELSTDGGITFNVIPGAEQLKPEAQDFTWQVPDIETTKAQIRVSTVDLGARRASSTTMNFTISRNGGGGGGDTQAPTVSFLSPKGGETFNSGDSLQISWSSSDNVGVTSQDLSLSTDGGSTFPITLANGLSGSAQQFTYQIPMSLQSNQTRLKLVVRDGAGNMAQATTPSNFSIMLGADNIPPTVTISQPTQSQSIIAGQAIQVKWQSTDNRAVVSQALLLSFDNGKTFSQIASFGATDSSFTLSNIDRLSFTTPQAIVKITAVDSTGNKGEANATFTISPAITNANYQTKVLTITGIGFMSNVNNNIKLIVNDKEVTLTPSNVSNSSFIIKGNKKKLNVVKGSNTIRLVVDGIMSNSIQFTF